MEKKIIEIKGVQNSRVYVLNERTDSVVGEGAYGEVFKGFIKNSNPLIKLAIKKIPDDIIKKIRKDYEKEVFEKLKRQGRNHHKHLCYTYDIIDHSRHECRYVIMELVEGGNLSTFIKKKKGFLSPKTIQLFFKQLILGLESLKKERIIHRDLKPENVLLTCEDENKCVLKICDFGTSKVVKGKSKDVEDMTKTRGCHGIGTPGYSAPELYLDHTETKYDRRVDLWSMGCILHLLCFGVRPFKVGGQNYRALWRKVYKGLQFDEIEVENRKVDKNALDLMLRLCRFDRHIKPPWKNRMKYEEFMNHPFVISCLSQNQQKEEEEEEKESILFVKVPIEKWEEMNQEIEELRKIKMMYSMLLSERSGTIEGLKNLNELMEKSNKDFKKKYCGRR